MILHRMTASFGCLNHATLELQDGLNLLYAPNESGKSTWCAFLLAMLYGINTRARDKKGNPSEKNRYRPWSGAPMDGLLDCTYEGKRIILRRTSEHGVPMGSFSAVYAETGETVPGLTGENVGEVFTGVGREVFERSLLIRQTNLPVEQSRELEQRIAALISSGDEQLSWSQADAQLREWQRSRRYNKTGQLVQLEEEAQSLQDRLLQLSSLWQESLLLEHSIKEAEAALEEQHARDAQILQAQQEESELRWAEAAAELDAAQLQLQTLETQGMDVLEEVQGEWEGEIEQLEEEIRRRGQALLLCSLFGLLLSVFLMISTFLPILHKTFSLSTFSVAIVLIGLVVILANTWRIRLDKRDLLEIERYQEAMDQQRDQLIRQDAAWESALARERAAQQLFDVLSRQREGNSYRSLEAMEMEASLSQDKERLALLSGRLQELGDPIQLEAELETNRNVQKRLQEEYDALSEAIAVLQDAEQELRARFSPALNHQTAHYFSRLTGGVYEKVTLERDFKAKTEKAQSLALRNAVLLSQGTNDQLYLALRLAICDLILPQDQSAPLILDDALSSFDDNRAYFALELLRDLGKKRQILFFSCHKREQQLLQHAEDVFYQEFTKS